MHRLFFKIKEKVYREGPVYNNFLLNYRAGIFLLNRLIKLRSFRKYRAAEIENITTLLEILDVPLIQHEGIISHYLFNNTWQNWKSIHYEQLLTFRKFWHLKSNGAIDQYIQNQQVIIFLYRHTALSNQHFSLVRHGIGIKYVGLGNPHSKNFLVLNGQAGLPEEVMNNPLKYQKIVRKHQLKKIVSVLNKAESYAINYFFDGQEGTHFQNGKIGELHYQLSTSLLRFLRPHTQLVLVEPTFAFDGSVAVQFHEVPRSTNYTEQLAYVQRYYERTFVAALPTLNKYMIKCLLKNHYALKDTDQVKPIY